MRYYITFSLCDETGEADLTPKSREFVDELIDAGDLFAVDTLGDMLGIITSAYEGALGVQKRDMVTKRMDATGESKKQAEAVVDAILHGVLGVPAPQTVQ